MRQLSVIVMMLSSLVIIFTGIAEANSTQLAGHHIVAASLFFIAACIHGWYNRKPVLRYFSGLGWRWAVIAGCLLAVLIVGRLIERI
jgi:Kef-type K+ transport system membrane component KefB